MKRSARGRENVGVDASYHFEIESVVVGSVGVDFRNFGRRTKGERC